MMPLSSGLMRREETKRENLELFQLPPPALSTLLFHLLAIIALFKDCSLKTAVLFKDIVF